MQNLTDQSIKHAPEGTYWDPTIKGFGVRIGKHRKTFMVLVASGRRQSIGHYPTMSLSDARKEAKRILAEKMLGKVRPTHTAWDDAKAQYLAYCATKLKPSTLSDYTKILRQHFPFGRTSVADITPGDIQHRIAKATHSRKRYAFATARAFLRWCVRHGIIDQHPMERLEVPRSCAARERTLSPDELQALLTWINTRHGTLPAIVGLLIATGQRRGEVAVLEWSWMSNDTITLPASVTKNKIEHTFPLSPSATALIDRLPHHKDCPYLFPASRTVSERTTVFNGWGKGKELIDQETGVTNWTLHDIRRTVASGMASLGVQQIVVEKLLNHVSGGTQSPISRVYNKHKYLDEMRDAVLLWDRYLANLDVPEA